MVIRTTATFDPARRIHAPNRLWGVFTRTEGSHLYGYDTFDGIAYGEMEPRSGVCARQRDPHSPRNNCGHWIERVSGLPVRARGCEKGCSIEPGGAAFDPEARWLTLTLYVREYDMQYSASFGQLSDYLHNALNERGLGEDALFMELGHIEAELGRHIGALGDFIRSPQSLFGAAQSYLKAHPAAPERPADAGIALGAGRS